MPISLLTAAERERWQRFPDTIPQDDLHTPVSRFCADGLPGDARRGRHLRG